MKNLASLILLFIVSSFLDRLEAQTPELRVGVLNELTGPVAFLGDTCQKGMTLAQNLWKKSHPHQSLAIKLIESDVHDDGLLAVTEFKRLVERENVSVVIAPRSKSAMPINPLAARMRVPIVGISAHPAFLTGNPWALRIYVPAEKDAVLLAKTAIAKGRSVALVTLEDEWALAISNAFVDQYTKLGGKIVYDQHVTAQDKDFSSIIGAIKASKPDLLFGFLLGSAGLFFKKVDEAAFKIPKFSLYWIQQPDQREVAGKKALEGLIFNEINSEQPQFMQAFKMQYPDQAYNPAAYLCYVSLSTILQISLVPEALESRTIFTEALINTKSVQLADGLLKFENREAQLEIVQRKFVDGVLVTNQFVDFPTHVKLPQN